MDLLLVLRTVSYLKVRQIVYQIKYRLWKPSYKQVCPPDDLGKLQLAECIGKPQLYADEKFVFLNLESRFASWNDTSKGMLWAYNLNYMDWLLQEGSSYEEGVPWLDKFCEEIGNNKVGLDPYPIALRGINWIKFISLYFDRIPATSRELWNDTLYSQYHLLVQKLEYHLLGNHLLEDTYSLYIASIYFKKKGWYEKGRKLLKQELAEQVLSDGMHYEQSPMYHCILLDRLLDCYNVSMNNVVFEGQEELNGYLREKAVQMLGHLESIVYEDGTLPLLNDSVVHIAPSTRDIFDYAKRLGLSWTEKELGASGYRKWKTLFGEAVVDIGGMTATYQPGHSHADTFSYELKIGGRMFVADCGISTYDKTERRQWERGTAAHNTVVIDGKNSSEVWGGFRVGRRARVRIVKEGENFVRAVHDGYGKGCLHQRLFSLKDDSFEVEDVIAEDAVSYIHLAPEITVLSFDKKRIETEEAIIEIVGADDVKLLDDFVSKEYNMLLPAKVVAIFFNRNMKYSISRK